MKLLPLFENLIRKHIKLNDDVYIRVNQSPVFGTYYIEVNYDGFKDDLAPRYPSTTIYIDNDYKILLDFLLSKKSMIKNGADLWEVIQSSKYGHAASIDGRDDEGNVVGIYIDVYSL